MFILLLLPIQTDNSALHSFFKPFLYLLSCSLSDGRQTKAGVLQESGTILIFSDTKKGGFHESRREKRRRNRGASGIGRGMSLRLARDGANVAVLDLN